MFRSNYNSALSFACSSCFWCIGWLGFRLVFVCVCRGQMGANGGRPLILRALGWTTSKANNRMTRKHSPSLNLPLIRNILLNESIKSRLIRVPCLTCETPLHRVRIEEQAGGERESMPTRKRSNLQFFACTSMQVGNCLRRRKAKYIAILRVRKTRRKSKLFIAFQTRAHSGGRFLELSSWISLEEKYHEAVSWKYHDLSDPNSCKPGRYWTTNSLTSDSLCAVRDKGAS